MRLQILAIHGDNKAYTFDFALLPWQFDSVCILDMDNLRHLPPFNMYFFELDDALIPRTPLSAIIALQYAPRTQRGERTITLIENVSSQTSCILQIKIYTYNIPTLNDFEVLIIICESHFIIRITH